MTTILNSSTKYRIAKNYKFWTHICVYTSIEGGRPSGNITLPLEWKSLPENLPKDDAAREAFTKKFYEDFSNVVDRKFTQALVPDLEYSLGGVHNGKLIALWYEPSDIRRRGDCRLVFIDSQYLEVIPA